MSTFFKPLLVYNHVLHVYFYYGELRLLFVYQRKSTFNLPPRIISCHSLWTTSTYSSFQDISRDNIYHTHRLLIIMAKTYRTNPHSEEPPRRSNRTAGKSPASIDLPARKPAAAAHRTTAAREDTAARKDRTAASTSGNSDKFIGERKGPPEAIVPAPEAVAVPCLPTLWEWTPRPSGVGGERKGPPEAIVPGPEDTMPSMVAHDFAADRDVAAAPRRTSSRYPMVAGEEGKHDGGVNYDDGYDSI